MLTLPGAVALSPFRLHRLLETLRARTPGVRAVHSRFMHFVQTDGMLDAGERDRLERLLQYGPRRQEDHAQGALFLVVPRPGTVSPWSSKATDITRNAGLDKVLRVERGIA